MFHIYVWGTIEFTLMMYMRFWDYDFMLFWDVISAATVYIHDDLGMFWINEVATPWSYMSKCCIYDLIF